MNREEIRASIFRAAALRMPAFDHQAPQAMQLEVLSDHLVAISIARAELEESRLYAREALQRFRLAWEEDYPGVSPDTLKAGRESSEAWKPRLAAMRDARYLVDRAAEGIERMDAEARSCSRLMGPLLPG